MKIFILEDDSDQADLYSLWRGLRVSNEETGKG